MTDAPPSRSPPCILVVDDDPAYREFLRLLLEADGYVVRLAGSPVEAHEALRAPPPRLVICDARLPGAPPFAVLDQLGRDPVTAAIPVLLCSGALDDLAAAGDRLAHPHVRALAKPFDIDELLRLVAALLAEAPAGPGRPS